MVGTDMSWFKLGVGMVDLVLVLSNVLVVHLDSVYYSITLLRVYTVYVMHMNDVKIIQHF